MAELELTRSPADRRRYELAGVGWLRLAPFWSRRRATAGAAGRTLAFARRSRWRGPVEAREADGALAGEFTGHSVRSGGHLRWGEREYLVRSASRWRSRYALALGERELAVLDGKGWGKRPVVVIVEDDAIDPALLLFACYIVHRLAEDSASAAA